MINVPSIKEFEEKKAKARRILDEVEIISNLMYESTRDAIECADEQDFHIDPGLLEKINKFLKLYALIAQGKYVMDGKLIDYKEELIGFFENYRDAVEPYAPFFEIPEYDELVSLSHMYDFHIVFVLYFKWHVTKETSVLSLLIEFFLYYFEGSEIVPVDVGEYSENERISGTTEYVKLAEMVRTIKDYLDDYEVYIKGLEDMTISESPYKNIIPYTDFLAGRVGLYWGESWIKGCGADFVIDYNVNPQKYEVLLVSEHLSFDEYYKLTRDLTPEEMEETGRFANAVLTKHIEAINVLSHLLKQLSEKDTTYNHLYRTLRIQMERIFSVLRIYSFDYYDNSDVEQVEKNAVEYKHQLMLEMTNQLLVCFNNRNLETLSQIKKELIPLYRYDAPWLLTQFEQSVLNVAEKITNIAVRDDEIKTCMAELDSILEGVNGYKEIRDNIIETFATAEILYKQYINGKECRPDWDYSFISILYYQVLEKALNMIIYLPYIEKTGRGPFDFRRVKMIFGEARCIEKLKNGSFVPKSSLELGSCGFLLSEVSKVEMYRGFIINTYPKASISSLVQMAKEIKEISKRRNKAAHPNIITYEDAREDRDIVYSGKIFNKVENLRNLFLRLLNIVYGF